MDRPFEGRIALVTGASRGLGRAAALGLSRAGAHVVALARTVGALEELDDLVRAGGGTATLVPMDMKDGDGLDRLGAALHERHGRLDCLFGNAAILGTVTPLGHMKPQAFEDVMSVNALANFRLLRSMDPLLKASDAGRALFVSASDARDPKPFVSAYAASKAALEAMVRSYAGEQENGTVRANVLEPGTLRTRMRARFAPGEDAARWPEPETVVPTVLRLLSADLAETGRVWVEQLGDWRHG